MESFLTSAAEERPYLKEEKQIPHLPHLVVVPGTLLSQWIDEIRTLFAPKGIDILTYPMGKDERQFFWGPNGPFSVANHSPSSIIIFVTQSVSEFNTDSSASANYMHSDFTKRVWGIVCEEI